MKKTFLTLASTAMMLAALAQPLHTFVTAYNTAGMPAGYAAYNPPGGFISHDRFDIACTQGSHYQMATGAITSSSTTNEIVLIKKDAITGAFTSAVAVDVNVQLGLSAGDDYAQALYLDDAANRAYIVGYIDLGGTYRAVITCINVSTMTIVTTFGTNGVKILTGLDSKATDITKTSTGNLAVIANVKSGTTDYISIFSVNTSGSVLSTTNITVSTNRCFANRIRVTPDNTYVVIAGHGISSAGVNRPMCWGYSINTTSPYGFTIWNNSWASLTSGNSGVGKWNDIAFYPAKITTSHPFGYDIITGGENTSNNNGIWAMYSMNTFSPNSSYTNTGTVPGTITDMRIERILIDPANFVTVCGTLPTGGPLSRLGYINTTGTAFTLTQTFSGIHAVHAMNKEFLGTRIVLGGCSPPFVTMKLNWNTTASSEFVNRIANPDLVFNEAQEYESTDQGCRIINTTKPFVYKAFSCFPNPATDQLSLELGQDVTASQYEIIDVAGKTIKSEQINFSGTNTISISDLPAGFYSVRILTGSGWLSEKLVKE